MTDETITNITDGISRILYECGSGALWMQAVVTTTAKREASLHDGHETTTRRSSSFIDSVSVDRGVVAE